MQNLEVAPYHLGVNGQGVVVDVSGKPFDASRYSRMKYGVKSEMKLFAQEIATEIDRVLPGLCNGVTPPAFVTSYKAVAPPATYLGRCTLDVINQARFEKGLRPGEMVQLYRPVDYIQEYAELPEAERKELLAEQGENTLRGRSLGGFVPVIFDDIKVTGSIAAMYHEALRGYTTVHEIFLAVCDESLARDPQAESLLNTSDIRTVSDVLPFIRSDDFVFTRRFLKMLLKTPPDVLQQVVPQLPAPLREQVARGIVDTGAELQELFPTTAGLLRAGF